MRIGQLASGTHFTFSNKLNKYSVIGEENGYVWYRSLKSDNVYNLRPHVQVIVLDHSCTAPASMRSKYPMKYISNLVPGEVVIDPCSNGNLELVVRNVLSNRTFEAVDRRNKRINSTVTVLEEMVEYKKLVFGDLAPGSPFRLRRDRCKTGAWRKSLTDKRISKYGMWMPTGELREFYEHDEILETWWT